LDNKKYTENGYLIVSESDKCPFWEKDTQPCTTGWNPDCFFCRFGGFRTSEYIRYAEEMPRGGPLHSVCRNEKNRKKENQS
jgi:hypothetical protein